MEIQSVKRAIQILSLFSYRRPLLGISEISRSLNLAKSTVQGLVNTLVTNGFLKQDSNTKKYRLWLKIYELGIILAGTLEINQKAISPAHDLAKKTRLMSRVAIWDGNTAVVTLIAYPHRSNAALPHQMGPRAHAYSSAIGKAILAFLEETELKAYLDRTKLIPHTPSTITSKKLLLSTLREIRERGYSTDADETMVGLGCIGAPIFDQKGCVVGSISLSGITSRVLGNQLELFAMEVKEAAFEISQYMGYFPDFS